MGLTHCHVEPLSPAAMALLPRPPLRPGPEDLTSARATAIRLTQAWSELFGQGPLCYLWILETGFISLFLTANADRRAVSFTLAE